MKLFLGDAIFLGAKKISTWRYNGITLIHAWYIYLHLVYCYRKFRVKYTSPMDGMDWGRVWNLIFSTSYYASKETNSGSAPCDFTSWQAERFPNGWTSRKTFMESDSILVKSLVDFLSEQKMTMSLWVFQLVFFLKHRTGTCWYKKQS